jgi:proteasome activator subunit 4
VQVIDAVTTACSQICIHLSEPLYDLVLNMVFDYASTNVRTNAVRAIHQLVECVANADPVKTLAKFLPFCGKNIRTELENGASSLRTTSSSTPLPSDATLHWSLWSYSTLSSFRLMTIDRSGHLERSGLQVSYVI